MIVGIWYNNCYLIMSRYTTKAKILILNKLNIKLYVWYAWCVSKIVKR